MGPVILNTIADIGTVSDEEDTDESHFINGECEVKVPHRGRLYHVAKCGKNNGTIEAEQLAVQNCALCR